MAGSSTNPVAPEIVQEHAEGWHNFTRFMTAGIIGVILVLLMFLLHFFIGWGYALFVMVVGFIATLIAVWLGKI
jgi:hypothetical protein